MDITRTNYFIMRKTTLLLVMALLAVQPLFSQNWKYLKKEGDEFYQYGNYYNAAIKYEQAFLKRPKDKDLAFKAAETYHAIKDYRKAAEYYQYLKDDNIRYPETGLKYARNLKQDGRYEDAIREFQAYLKQYSGSNRAMVEETINAEIAGCRLAKDLPARANKDAEFKIFGKGINTEDNEFAPIPFGSDTLYFSTTKGGKAKILSTNKSSGAWSRAENPASFPLIQNDHYCNGTLSSDRNRFYFTICRGTSNWGALSTRCEIFFTIRQGVVWSQPIKLPDFINLSNFTNTQPFVYTQNGLEYLIFSSNRTGGRGGMDLWMSSRDASDDNSEFSFPANLGPVINTANDEVTPFYDINQGILYFSSNGHVSIGGFDVFKSSGTEDNWDTPENVGLPFNSSADDLYYVLSADRTNGFLSSNRTFGGQKTNTRDEDIFEFTTGIKKLTVQGKVTDSESGDLLTDVTVQLLLIQSNGSEEMMTQQISDDGSYQFDLLPNRSYKIALSKAGYDNMSYLFATNDPSTPIYGKPVTMTKTPVQTPQTDERPVATKTPVKRRTNSNPVKTPEEGQSPTYVDYGDDFYTLTAIGPNDNKEYSSNAPRYQGTYYKVQLIALKKFNPDYSRYSKVLFEAVTMHTEFLTENRLTRVLLGDFASSEEAKDTLRQVKKLGFPRAFMVKYIDGVRYGIIR
jgi:tetratricopeptide (TPR) repeat protein